jgi:hypothetical protein
MPEEEKAVSIRIPPENYEKIFRITVNEHRSVNQQINMILDNWLKDREAALKTQGDWPDK